MKMLATVLFAFALTAVYSQPVDIEIAENPIDKLVREALEFIRSLFKKYEPFPVPPLPVQYVRGEEIDLAITFKDIMVSQASDFKVIHIENHVIQMWAKFAVTVPKMHLEGGYSVTGSVKSKKVKGNGHFKLDINQLKTSGYVKVGLVDRYLQMKTLDIDYDIKGLKFSADGLEVEGMTQEQLADMFNRAFLGYFQNNKKFVASQVSNYVMGYANKLMKGKSLHDLIEWLKHFIHNNIFPGFEQNVL